MQRHLPKKWPRKEFPQTHTQPRVETTLSLAPVLPNSDGKGKKKKNQRKGKSPKQVYSSFNKFYLMVGSSWLLPKDQKLLQMCPMDKKVEEKLLESCLCSKKESVLTVRAVLQKCPWQGLRTRGCEGARGQPGLRRLEATLQGTAFRPWVTGCLEAMAGHTSQCLTPAAMPAAGEPLSPALPRWLTGSLAPGPRREQTESLGAGLF